MLWSNSILTHQWNQYCAKLRKWKIQIIPKSNQLFLMTWARPSKRLTKIHSQVFKKSCSLNLNECKTSSLVEIKSEQRCCSLASTVKHDCCSVLCAMFKIQRWRLLNKVGCLTVVTSLLVQHCSSLNRPAVASFTISTIKQCKCNATALADKGTFNTSRLYHTYDRLSNLYFQETRNEQKIINLIMTTTCTLFPPLYCSG